jgi:hypothetical protein
MLAQVQPVPEVVFPQVDGVPGATTQPPGTAPDSVPPHATPEARR